MKLIKAKKYLCMLLAAMLVSAAAIGVNAEEQITGIGDWLVDIGISEDSIDDYPVEDELVPQAATACNSYPAYPPNEGFLNGEYTVITLEAGTVLQQYYRSSEANSPPGSYFCDVNTSPELLALPPLKKPDDQYLTRTITLSEPTQFKVGIVAPWGGCYNG